MSDGAALRLEDVACLRGGRMLFRGVNLALRPGQGAVLTGPNGIGKSSLLRICAGLLPTYAGRIERAGIIALADEKMALDQDATLGKTLGFWASLDGVGQAAITAALEAMALTVLADVPVRILSTGQRKRAALARVIASGAAIWLLDEPGNGLDAASLDLLGQAVQRHLASGGIVVAASHQPLPIAQPVLLSLADHVPVETA